MEQLIFWLAGVFGVLLVNALKQRFGLQGRTAMWLTAAVAAGLAVLALAAGGLLGSPAGWEPQQLFTAFGQVLAAATLAYKLLSGE